MSDERANVKIGMREKLADAGAYALVWTIFIGIGTIASLIAIGIGHLIDKLIINALPDSEMYIQLFKSCNWINIVIAVLIGIITAFIVANKALVHKCPG